MSDVLRCLFCGARSVKVLPADGSRTELHNFLCTACSNRWSTPGAPADSGH